MMYRILLLLIAVLVGFSAQADDKFDVDNHEAFLVMHNAIYFDSEVRLENDGVVKGWVEIDIEISNEQKFVGYEIIDSSSSDLFNHAILKNLNGPYVERYLQPKMVDGKPVSSKLKYRYDIYFNGLDSYDGVLIMGHIKLLKSTIDIESNNTEKKVLVYFQFEVPENKFSATQVENVYDDFIAINIKKNLALPFFSQNKYARDFGFNTLQNKELLSLIEFTKAFKAYTKSEDMLISDQFGNFINPETFNEHKPLVEKTEYWFTRPKSAKPQFSQEKYLFGDYSAELDALDFQGLIKLTAHVEPTGLLNNIEIIEGSGIDRVDEITLKVLDRMYITPAYQDYRNVADDIEFEVSFQR